MGSAAIQAAIKAGNINIAEAGRTEVRGDFGFVCVYMVYGIECVWGGVEWGGSGMRYVRVHVLGSVGRST